MNLLVQLTRSQIERMLYLNNCKIFGVTSLRSTGVWGVLSSFAVHFKRSLSARVGDPEATENCRVQ